MGRMIGHAEKVPDLERGMARYDGHFKNIAAFLPRTTEKQRIQIHLAILEKRFRAGRVRGLSKEQRSNRLHLMDLLRDYREAGKFPENHRFLKRTPEFIGDNGAVCAVGYLVEKTAGRKAVETISHLENEALVMDMKNPLLPPWLRQWGLSCEEAAMIQPRYSFVPTGFSPVTQRGVSVAPTLPFESAKFRAEKGDPDAEYQLGRYYLGGYQEWEGYTDDNREKGLEWIKKAAQQGWGPAENELGSYFETGYASGKKVRGLNKDLAEAKKWYGLARDHGDVSGANAYVHLETENDPVTFTGLLGKRIKTGPGSMTLPLDKERIAYFVPDEPLPVPGGCYRRILVYWDQDIPDQQAYLRIVGRLHWVSGFPRVEVGSFEKADGKPGNEENALCLLKGQEPDRIAIHFQNGTSLEERTKVLARFGADDGSSDGLNPDYFLKVTGGNADGIIARLKADPTVQSATKVPLRQGPVAYGEWASWNPASK
ncbi:MAG TPA: tetratricopeptide repeat protein [bacterium]|nr:tetratricopeptide repeat protein [bacterium]